MDLAGGGTDVDAAFQGAIDAVRGCSKPCTTTIDIVILRASGADGYNAYLYAMDGVDSVETLVVRDRSTSFDPSVVETVRGAELVFFAGGDQCNYVTYFKDTPIEEAVSNLYARGGGIGGTSAGLAILGSTVYDACTAGVSTAEALADPYDPSITFTQGFFDFPFLRDVVTDTHFVARDRMGRLMTFLARRIEDGHATSLWGLGIEEGTSVVVDARGLARVVGDGPAYLVYADAPPVLCTPRRPLGYAGYKIWKFATGETFSLATRPSVGYAMCEVDAGVLASDPY